jgi:hypothetical protein
MHLKKHGFPVFLYIVQGFPLPGFGVSLFALLRFFFRGF